MLQSKHGLNNLQTLFASYGTQNRQDVVDILQTISVKESDFDVQLTHFINEIYSNSKHYPNGFTVATSKRFHCNQHNVDNDTFSLQV